MYQYSFFGVIQGLPKNVIVEILKMKGLKENDYSLTKISIFRTSKHILTKIRSQYLEDKNFNKNLEKDNYWDGSFIGDVSPSSLEDLLVLITSLLVILILFALWMFLVIPIILIIISLISVGEAWRMLRIFLIEIKFESNPDFRAIIHEIHVSGGTTSKNWLTHIFDESIIRSANEIRDNYVWFMRGISIISYSLLLLAVVFSIIKIFEFFLGGNGDIFIIYSYYIFSIIAFIGLLITMFFLVKQKKIKPYLEHY